MVSGMEMKDPGIPLAKDPHWQSHPGNVWRKVMADGPADEDPRSRLRNSRELSKYGILNEVLHRYALTINAKINPRFDMVLYMHD